MDTPRPPAAIAADINAHTPGWIVFWSPWRRCYTAIAACTPQACVLDHPNPARLLDQMRTVQTAASTKTRPS